ncbi:MAG TPA: hypothetical protein VHN79_14395, partial [Lacunisphaera sp.]|nr:hypothetical protein [Lacunisphaera sp.]
MAAGAPSEQSEEALGMAEMWSDRDARAALEFVANTPRFPGRLEALAAPLARLGEGDLAFVVNWMRAQLTIDERAEVAPLVAHKLGQKDAALALEFAFAPDLPVDRDTFGDLIASLVRTQPARALAYFDMLSEEGRVHTVKPLVEAWVATDREAALQWWLAQRNSLHGQPALEGLIQAVALNTPDDLAAIIDRLSLKPEDFADMYFGYHQIPADAALTLLPYLSEQGRRHAVAQLVREELQRDPSLALQLARGTLPSATSDAVIREAWDWWFGSDAKAARA